MAGNNDYVIPFGVDAKDFFAGLNSMDDGVDKLTAGVTEASKAMQKGFGDAAAAGDKLGAKLQVNAEQAAALRNEAKTLGKELGEALSGKGASAELEKKLTKFNDLVAKFSTQAGKGLKFNIDTAKLEQFEQMLAAGVNELEVLNKVIEVSKQELASLDPNSEEFAALNAQLQVAEGFLEGLGQAAAGAEVKNKSLKGQLREMKATLAEMELAGKGNTQEFQDLSIAAGALEDQIGDVSSRVRVLASDTKYLDAGVQAIQGLAGAFTAAQGAAAIFGGESEEVQKVIQKVTGAMALLQGIQAVASALNKDNALSVLFLSGAQTTAAASATTLAVAEGVETAATVGATAATNGFTAALLANPFTAIAVAVAALVAAIIIFINSSDDAEDATKRLTAALEYQGKVLDLDEQDLKRRTDLLVARAKAQGKAESDITTIEGQALAERINLRQKAYNETVTTYDKQLKLGKLSAEENQKIQDSILKQEAQLKDDQTELEVKRLDRATQLRKEGKDAEKKSLEDAKKLAEERKKILEQQIKYTAELEKTRIDSIKDAYDKERAEVTQQANERIAQLQADKSLSAKAEQDKQAILKNIRSNLGTTLSDIDKKEAADQAALQFKAAQLTIQYREDGIVKEIETIRLGFEEKKNAIREEYKNEIELRDQLIDQVNAAQIVAQKKAQDDFANNAIQAEGERAALEVETAAKFIPDLPGVEEQKQVEILKVKVKYAQLALEALIAQGNAENSTVVLQAKKQVQDLQKALGDAVKDAAGKSQGVDFFKLLGLGDLTNEQRDAVVGAAQSALDSITQITDFIVDQYQRQIDAKQELIDKIDEGIDELEDQLAREQDLQEQGFANNVDAIKAELDEKKKAREEELKQQEELQKKQQQIAKAQLILDTIVQASNLVTAATKIFNALAGIPFVGIPLAIATVGLMVGAFVAAKVKSFQIVNSQKQQFGQGGYIDGKPHSQGGKKYLAEDGSGGVVELEGGEHVTNKRQTAKYSDLLEAINNDRLSGMSEEALRDMLEGLGISLSSESPKKVVKVIHERDGYKQQFLMMHGPDLSGDVKAINENVAYMAARERERPERWEDEKYYYSKEGSKTTRILKKQS